MSEILPFFRLLARAKIGLQNYKRYNDLKPLEAKISRDNLDSIGRFKSCDVLQFCNSDFGSSKQPEKHGT